MPLNKNPALKIASPVVRGIKGIGAKVKGKGEAGKTYVKGGYEAGKAKVKASSKAKESK